MKSPTAWNPLHTALALLAVVSVVSGGTSFNFHGGPSLENYEWTVGELSEYVHNVTWHPITSTRLEGWAPGAQITEIYLPEKAAMGDFLRREGGIVGQYVQVCLVRNGVRIRIKNIEELKRAICPLTNSVEATSFVALVISDLMIANGRLVGWTATLDDLYLVQVTYQDSYGCTQHRPVGVLLAINKHGDVTVAAKQMLPRDRFTTATCVD